MVYVIHPHGVGLRRGLDQKLEMMLRSGIGEFGIELVGIKSDHGDAKVAGFTEELRFGEPAQFGSFAGRKTTQFKKFEGKEKRGLVFEGGWAFAQGKWNAFIVGYGQGLHLEFLLS